MPPAVADAASPRRRRRRAWIYVFLAIVLLLLAGAWALARMLEPERLSAFLLQRASAATGLELALASPADVAPWPDLHIELAGLSARLPERQGTVLQAERVDLVLPWSSLWNREPVIRHLRLVGPMLDRDALAQWREARARDQPAGAFELPELTASLSVENGRIIGQPGEWQLQGLQLQTSALQHGQPFHAAAAATLLDGEQARPLQLTIDTVPTVQHGALLLDPLALGWSDDSGQPPLQGRLRFDPPSTLRLELATRIDPWPASWPALPATGSTGPVALALAYEGEMDGSGLAGLTAQRGTAGLRAQSQLQDLLQWLASSPRTPLPPAWLVLRAEELELGGVRLRGVEATLDAADAPAEPPPDPGSTDAARD